MIHQPIHLLGAYAYGLLSLTALGFGVARLKARNPAPRTAPWLLLCIGVGLGLWAANEWRAATQWPPVRVIQHGLLYDIGSAFIAVSFLCLLWTSLKLGAGAEAGATGDQGDQGV